MIANQIECCGFEQMSVIKFLAAEKGKPCEIYGKNYSNLTKIFF